MNFVEDYIGNDSVATPKIGIDMWREKRGGIASRRLPTPVFTPL